MGAGREARVAAVVLAAGSSSRMGGAKQLLRLGDRTLLDRTLDNVRASAAAEIVLVLGASATSIRREIAPATIRTVKVVVNADYGLGVASSLRTGLASVGSAMDGALIVLADQPFVRPATFNRMIEEYRRTDAEILIPVHGRVRGNPVLLGRSIFPEAMALTGDTGCRAIFGMHPDEIAMVEVDDAGILLDIDAPEDYERLRDFGAGGLE